MTMNRAKPGSVARRLRGCGCAVLLLVAVGLAAIFLGGMKMLKPYNQAIDLRQELDDLHGGQDTFTPRPDGTVPAERMKVFLSIREDLMESCPLLAESFGAIGKLEQFDGVDDPPKREVLRAAWEATTGIMGLAPAIGNFALARNETLLRHGMGLGEYTYIYALAYGDRLVQVRTDGDTINITTHISYRVRNVLADMLRRQVEAVDPEEEWAGVLRNEIARIDGAVMTVPWAEGYPPAVEDSLSPYRRDLGEKFCPHTIDLELAVNRRLVGGIGIESD